MKQSLNADCIVLIITKVEDPDELDTRFSKFAPSVHEDGGDLDEMMDSVAGGTGADDVLDLSKKSQVHVKPQPPLQAIPVNPIPRALPGNPL